jgi:hypothetical protein
LSGLAYKVPLYYKINVIVKPYTSKDNFLNTINRTIGVVVDYNYAPKQYDELLVNGFYVHGRAGIFNEINYYDSNTTNQISPTK